MSGDANSMLGRSGWFPDPTGRHEFRFHNGVSWTADVADDGERFVDAAGTDLGAPDGASGGAAGGSRRNRLAVAGLVCGIIAIGVGLIPFLFVVGFLAAVLALVFGTIGLRRSRPDGVRRGASIAALVTGVTGLLAAVGGLFLTSALIDAVDRFEEPGAYELAPVSCLEEDSAWVASGAITNQEADVRSYTLTVEFLRPGTDNVQASVRVRLDDVAPGADASFEVRRLIDLDEVTCEVTRVDGPPPFGLDIGG